MYIELSPFNSFPPVFSNGNKTIKQKKQIYSSAI